MEEKERDINPNWSIGLDIDEQNVVHYLVYAWNGFVRLDNHRKDDIEDFRKCIHKMEDIIGMRIVRRQFPNGWE